ncbi:MAG TPA: DUF5615 family PIN-like protein [Ardenticatenaceae bacterium]|jgi:predicted nuclease of predicted toxin-antitoxin system
MPIALYMDQHVPKPITSELRKRGVDVLTAYEDGTSALDDSALLDRATELGRILVTQDKDFLAEGAYRQKNGVPFAGIVYMHLMRVPLSTCIDELETIAMVGEPEDLLNSVQFLPL